jgi:hypothetical protein
MSWLDSDSDSDRDRDVIAHCRYFGSVRLCTKAPRSTARALTREGLDQSSSSPRSARRRGDRARCDPAE